jgi:hypothetical protein
MEPLDAAELQRLIAQGLSPDAVQQQQAARAINVLLKRMRTEGDREANARAIADALASQSLVALETYDERSCRAEAVETLLRLGFPQAMEISTEDVAHHKKHRTGRGPGWVPIAAVVLSCWLFLSYGLVTDHAPFLELFLILASVVFLLVRWLQRYEWRKHERL